ncbi:MAG: nuclear transport factor 2 family protein [Deltaproteobacteria bacterium]|nr:nuclear transport factor 2 family protein [Deltaproteobacteria bacterium]
MERISNEEIARILGRYIEGKDENRPEILKRIYAPDARVLFDLRTTTITFPPEIRTNDAIAEVLSADFNRRFVSPRTYYLEECSREPGDNAVRNLPWLVIMRESATGRTRVGWGLYDWFFALCPGQAPEWKIALHRICIQEMMDREDRDGALLDNLQSALSHPWPTPAEIQGLPGVWPALNTEGFPPKKDEG